jgi:hypothetical protein
MEKNNLKDFITWCTCNVPSMSGYETILIAYKDYLKSFKEALSESQSVSDNEHTQEECHVAYCKNPLYKEIYCKAHYKQKYGAL